MGVSVFKAIRSPIAKAIYIFLAVSFFVGFGILTSLQPNQSLPKIKFGEKDIYADEFFLVLREFQDSEMDEQQTIRNAFDIMLARKAIAYLLEENGFELTDEMVSSIIMGSAGVQKYQDYMNLIRSVGATRRSLENYVKDSYYFSRFQDIIVRTETSGDFREFEEIVSWVAGVRTLVFAEIKKSSFNVSISESEMKNFYILNKANYKIPETRDLWIAKFPSSETASAFYDSGKKFERFEDFEIDVKNSGGNATEVRIGKDKATDVLSQFFSDDLTEGTLLKPIEVRGEWWVIFIKKVNKEREKTYEEALPEIKENLISKKILENLQKFLSDKENDIRSVQDFEKVFSPISEKIQQEKAVSYIEIYPVVGSVPELTQAVLSRNQNFLFPKPIQKGEKIYVVFIGEHIQDNTAFSSLLRFDIEKFLQDSIVFVFNQKKVVPPSKEEAIKILMGK